MVASRAVETTLSSLRDAAEEFKLDLEASQHAEDDCTPPEKALAPPFHQSRRARALFESYQDHVGLLEYTVSNFNAESSFWIQVIWTSSLSVLLVFLIKIPLLFTFQPHGYQDMAKYGSWMFASLSVGGVIVGSRSAAVRETLERERHRHGNSYAVLLLSKEVFGDPHTLMAQLVGLRDQLSIHLFGVPITYAGIVYAVGGLLFSIVFTVVMQLTMGSS